MLDDKQDREALEAELMGGESQAEKEPDIVSASEVEPKVKEVEPVVESEAAPEETLEQLRERLAKTEEERSNYQRAMQEERESKKASDRTLQALVERLENIQKEKKAPEQVDQPPIYEEDPAAYLKWQNDQILADRRRELEQRQQTERQSVEQQQFQQLQQHIKQGFNEYAEKTPDYNDAAKYLIEARIKELEIMGVRDKQEQMATLNQEEMQVGTWALQRGISPGELVYNLAKARGYSGPVQAPAQGAPNPNNKPQVKSLSNISGTPSGNKESLQARAERILAQTGLKGILSLDPDEMEKILKETR